MLVTRMVPCDTDHAPCLPRGEHLLQVVQGRGVAGRAPTALTDTSAGAVQKVRSSVMLRPPCGGEKQDSSDAMATCSKRKIMISRSYSVDCSVTVQK